MPRPLVRLLALRGIRYPVVGFTIVGVLTLAAVLGRPGRLHPADAVRAGGVGAALGLMVYLNIRRDEQRGWFDDSTDHLRRTGSNGALELQRPNGRSPQAVASYARQVRSHLRELDRELTGDSSRSTLGDRQALAAELQWAAKRLGLIGRLLA